MRARPRFTATRSAAVLFATHASTNHLHITDGAENLASDEDRVLPGCGRLPSTRDPPISFAVAASQMRGTATSLLHVAVIEIFPMGKYAWTTRSGTDQLSRADGQLYLAHCASNR